MFLQILSNLKPHCYLISQQLKCLKKNCTMTLTNFVYYTTKQIKLHKLQKASKLSKHLFLAVDLLYTTYNCTNSGLKYSNM